MSDHVSQCFGWREIFDGEAWDDMLAELNGHPLQSARWGEARRQVDGHESLYLMFEESGNPLCMARVETRRLPVVGKAAWIPRGPSRALNVGSCDVGIGLRQELRRYGFSLIITDEYSRGSDKSDIRTIWIDLEQGLDVLKKRIDKQWLYGTRRATREGVEVVQLYLADLESRLARPEQELKAFHKLPLAPGERQTVRFVLDPRALSYWDPASGDGGDWQAEPGEFEVRVGRSSRDIRARARFTLAGES